LSLGGLLTSGTCTHHLLVPSMLIDNWCFEIYPSRHWLAIFSAPILTILEKHGLCLYSLILKPDKLRILLFHFVYIRCLKSICTLGKPIPFALLSKFLLFKLGKRITVHNRIIVIANIACTFNLSESFIFVHIILTLVISFNIAWLLYLFLNLRYAVFLTGSFVFGKRILLGCYIFVDSFKAWHSMWVQLIRRLIIMDV